MILWCSVMVPVTVNKVISYGFIYIFACLQCKTYLNKGQLTYLVTKCMSYIVRQFEQKRVLEVTNEQIWFRGPRGRDLCIDQRHHKQLSHGYHQDRMRVQTRLIIYPSYDWHWHGWDILNYQCNSSFGQTYFIWVYYVELTSSNNSESFA